MTSTNPPTTAPTLTVPLPAAADGAPAPSPSGSATPTSETLPGDLPGWRRVLADDFDGSSINEALWGTYWGQPDGEPGAWWDPSHVVVGDGMLQLQTYRDASGRWVSGGVSSARALRQTYGKYLVRFRLVYGYEVTSILMLMGSYQWPPEIDFAENGGEDPYSMSAVLHHGPDDRQIFNEVRADFTQWHTIGVEWSPGAIDYTLDGEVWGQVRGAAVPTVPMDFVMQTQAGTCRDGGGCPDARTSPHASMQVDWVAAYAAA